MSCWSFFFSGFRRRHSPAQSARYTDLSRPRVDYEVERLRGISDRDQVVERTVNRDKIDLRFADLRHAQPLSKGGCDVGRLKGGCGEREAPAYGIPVGTDQPDGCRSAGLRVELEVHLIEHHKV